MPNCSTGEIAAIRTALAFLVSSGQPCVSRTPGLGSLASCLSTKNETSITLDCRGGSCSGSNPPFGTTNAVGGSEVDFCDPALPPSGLQADTDVTLFHEFVHTCGGLEIDAWSMENNCYAGHGTIDPPAAAVSGFMGETSDAGNGLRAGTFVLWEPSTGRVFVKVSSGGSWNSSPTLTKGTELSVNNAAYMVPPPSGGGSWV